MLLAAAALAGSPIQAGFPCRDAETAQERLVCARPALAAADVELNRSYRAASAQLGPEGRRQLRISQRAWVNFRDSVCPIDRSGHSLHRSAESCLEARYAERSAELRDAVRQLGPFRVVRLDGYRLWPAPGRTMGWYDDVITHEERVDWIDSAAGGSPATAAAARWNARVSSRPTMSGTRWRRAARARSETDPGGDYGGLTQTGRDLEIVAASADVVVSRIVDYWMGGAHPEESVSYETLLVPERRNLRLGDLVEWPAAFAGAAYRRLAAAYPELDFSGFRHVPDSALSPGTWEPTRAGLVVHYGTIFGRPSGDMAAIVGWRQMAPFLSARGRRIAASFGGAALARAR